MMMTSNPRFVLMQPQTLAIIHKTVAFRKETHLPICFTLDAGANVHLLYPIAQQQPITDFIQSELVAHCQDGQYISDQLGTGAQKL
jgi:diphosphomevalonate decarboxylase